jgi:hypothetical protein
MATSRDPKALAVAVRADPGARAAEVDGDADGPEPQPPAVAAGVPRRRVVAGEERGAEYPATGVLVHRRRVEQHVAAGDGVADEEGVVAFAVAEEEEPEVGVEEDEVGEVGDEVEGEARRGGGGGEGMEDGDGELLHLRRRGSKAYRRDHHWLVEVAEEGREDGRGGVGGARGAGKPGRRRGWPPSPSSPAAAEEGWGLEYCSLWFLLVCFDSLLLRAIRGWFCQS